MALHFKENREMNKINQLDDFAPRIMALYDERLQTWAKRAMQQMKEMRETDTPPQLILNHHCPICEFGQRCQSEAIAKDDISLLRGVSEKEVRKYNRRGIFTVTQLSCTFRPRKRAAVLGHPATAIAILANHLGARGQEIPAGAMILPGGVTEAVAVQAGDKVTLKIQHLGSISMRFV
jgi:hypothetical protein